MTVEANPNVTGQETTSTGSKAPTLGVVFTEHCEVSMQGPALYTEVLIPLMFSIGNMQKSSSGGVYTYTFRMNPRSGDTRPTLTLEGGTKNRRGTRIADVVLTGASFQFDRRGGVSVNSSGFGGLDQENLSHYLVLDESVYSTSSPDNPIAFECSGVTTSDVELFGGEVTAPAAIEQALLTAMNTAYSRTFTADKEVTVVDMTTQAVAAGLTGKKVYHILFGGELTRRNVRFEIKKYPAAAAGKEAAYLQPFFPATKQFREVPIEPTHVEIYYSTTSWADLIDLDTEQKQEQRRLHSAFMTSVGVDNKYVPLFVFDREKLSYSMVGETMPSGSFSMQVAADDEGMQFYEKVRNRDMCWFRIEAKGGLIGASNTNYRLTIDFAAILNQIGGKNDIDGSVLVRDFSGVLANDSTRDGIIEVTLVTSVNEADL